jgi:hypothetical protein
MPRRKREHTWYTREVRRLKGLPALLLGLVDAEDEAEALGRAIKQFDVRLKIKTACWFDATKDRGARQRRERRQALGCG